MEKSKIFYFLRENSSMETNLYFVLKERFPWLTPDFSKKPLEVFHFDENLCRTIQTFNGDHCTVSGKVLTYTDLRFKECFNEAIDREIEYLKGLKYELKCIPL